MPRALVQNREPELIADGNTGFDQDGNWRLRIDGRGDFVIEARDSRSWVRLANWTSPGR